MANPKIEKQLTIKPKRVVVPDYHSQQLVSPDKRPKLEHEKPIETPTPEPEPKPEPEKKHKFLRKPSPSSCTGEPKAVPAPEPVKTVELGSRKEADSSRNGAAFERNAIETQ